MRRSHVSSLTVALALSAPAAAMAQTRPQPTGTPSASAESPEASSEATASATPTPEVQQPADPAPTDTPAPAPRAEDTPAPVRATPPPPDLLDRVSQAFTLHGYLRVRPEMQHNFAIGWDRPALLLGGTGYNYANAAWPWARNPDNGLGGLCSVAPPPGQSARIAQDCSNNFQTMANMRLRLQPEIHVTDSISVHAQIDIFDNLILGSTPQGYSAGRAQGASPWAPITALSQTQVTPYERNSLVPSIAVSRAWAEVTNPTLGQIRFGRMPWHWGLGILSNQGNGVDSDYQTHVDRIMYMLRLRGPSLFAAAMYDFASTGLTSASYRYEPGQGQIIDLSTLDDVHQVGLAFGRRVEAAEARQSLARGNVVFNGGFYGLLRWQTLSTENVFTDPMLAANDPRAGGDADVLRVQQAYTRRDALMFTGDLWFQLLHKNFRVEAEAVFNYGNTAIGPTLNSADPQRYDLRSFGGALEFEYRLLNNRLQIEFRTGYATGDSDIEGLNYQSAAFNPRRTTATSVTQHSFHPDYRVDLILWRQIFRQVSGAYYFRPGVMYAFVNSPAGDRFYGRASVIWSRASEFVQSRGNAADLGLEINAELTYQSNYRDPTLGATATPGFYASVQYGMLFPLEGLGPLATERAASGPLSGFEFSNAQTLRGILGVQF